ncbi:hypothetical protein D9M68_294840 [compost metagenome]
MWMPRVLLIVLLVALAACAGREPAAEAPPPAPPSEYSWRQIDQEIVGASEAAQVQAEEFAQASMDRWMDLVYQRTDSHFVPWFSGYWTQQWLSMKVGWYRLDSDGEKEQVVQRLAQYLQEQYRKRVLDPVARTTSPEAIMQQATRTYVQLLGQHLAEIPPRHGVPAALFERRLQEIPAILPAAPGSPRASLYQIIHTDPVTRLPAYAALIQGIRQAGDENGVGNAHTGISSVAADASARLEAELVTGGVASVVGMAIGRVAGSLLSLGASGFTAIARENARPKLEAQLRQNLNAAFDEQWLDLMRNSSSGVLAGVHSLAGQIESGVAATAGRDAGF